MIEKLLKIDWKGMKDLIPKVNENQELAGDMIVKQVCYFIELFSVYVEFLDQLK